MKIYSPAAHAFYAPEFEADYRAGGAWPADGVEITDELHAELLEAQSAGKVITADEDGNPIAVDPPPPTREQSITILRAAVQAHLDDAARQYGYLGIDDAVTYADESTVPQYEVEGKALRTWRSQVRQAAKAVFDAWHDGDPAPTPEQVLAVLPAFEAP